ncbi:hypothetical protein [Paracoccus mutanolyticus]|uniref:hypothetical protein n=1 Tax=Paracoccus mutanolyticus TaxID=1499308 RepID=UPI001CB90ED2|nr:hypothetical protein [Paracoccus mutanolyticus]
MRDGLAERSAASADCTPPGRMDRLSLDLERGARAFQRGQGLRQLLAVWRSSMRAMTWPRVTAWKSCTSTAET